MLAADQVTAKGHLAFIPHLAVFWQMSTDEASQTPEKDWLNLGLRMLERCDSIYRIPGESSGSDGEIEHAKKLGIPIYYSMEEVPQAIPTPSAKEEILM